MHRYYNINKGKAKLRLCKNVNTSKCFRDEGIWCNVLYCKLMVFVSITSCLFPFSYHTLLQEHLGLLGSIIMHLHHDSLTSSCIVYMCWQSYHPHIEFVNPTLIPIQNLLKCISPWENESPNRDLITVSSGEDRKWDRKSNFILFPFWGYCFQNKSFVRAWKEVEAS